ncbi:MAG TPA: dTDP-4-dehydrorhamnose 3,5-epimerase family protein [Candidatus Sulfopaludibacter sp.]|nr:dTDP-4-dehydrorhamnose 3,5-epimerase family protein [Candidatus Sulfopaludibacter sp.]
MIRTAPMLGKQIEFRETALPGCHEVLFPVHDDERGSFVKAHYRSAFEAAGLEADFAECFHTVSHAGVLRGMHLQFPPADQAKLVYCVAGAVMDVALDVRRGSPAYGRHVRIELGGGRANGLYLPRGVAHGFYVWKGPAILVYHVTSEYAPALDAGVRWDSFGAEWPARSPLLSTRDAALPVLGEFASPFRYRGLA